MSRFRKPLFWTASIYPLLACSLLHAQVAQPRLNQLSPIGAKRGGTVEITLTGTQIGQATGLLIDGGGIAVESISIPKDRPNTALAKVNIAPDALPGVRAVRVLTKFGASDRQLFCIGAYNEAAEKEPNNTRDKAQELGSLPITLNGKSDGGEDVDWYKFKGQKGQTYIVEVMAARLESPFDSVLTIQDAQGHELTINDDYYGTDSFLSFTPKTDGDYYVQIHDLRYQGGGNFFYRLTVGVIPRVTSIFTNGGQAGHGVNLEKHGYNLGGATSQPITLPNDTTLSQTKVGVMQADGSLITFPFGVSDLNERNEIEPNDLLNRADSLPIPCVMNGRIAPAPSSKSPDTDYFRFKGEKGKKLVFEVIAHRLGSRLESQIYVRNLQGSILTQSDDNSREADQRIEFMPPDNGEYILQIRDLYGKGGDEYPYRLSATEATPDFRLTFSQDRLVIGQGNRAPLQVTANRLNGYNGEITLDLEGLPAGVVLLTPATISAGRNEAFLVLSADATAQVKGQPFHLIGRAVINKRKVAHEAQALETTQRENNISTLPRELATVSVTEPLDISIALSMEKITLAPGESKEIVVKVTRRAGFNPKVPISVLGVPSGVTVTVTPAEVPEKQTEVKIVIKAEGNAPIGELSFVVAGRSLNEDVRPYYYAAPPLLVTIAKK